MLEHTPFALVVVASGRVVDANPRAARLFGFESVAELDPSCLPDAGAEATTSVLGRRDGTSFRARVWRTGAGADRALYSLMHTEEVRIADDLSLVDEGTVAQFLEAVPVGIFVTTADGRPLYANRRAADILGRGVAPDAGSGELAEIYHVHVEGTGDDYPPARMPIVRALSGESATVEDMVIQHPDGPIYLQVWGSPIRDPAGAIGYAIAAFQDITDRREAEARTAKLHRQMADLAREAGRAEIAAGVLHNVGNVLNSINVSSRLIEELCTKLTPDRLPDLVALLDRPPRELANFLAFDARGRKIPLYLRTLVEQLVRRRQQLEGELESLRDSVGRAKSIVLSHQRFLGSKPIYEKVEVGAVVDEVLSRVHGRLTRYGVAVQCELGREITIEVDKHRLLQILTHLLTNAADAIERAGVDDGRIVVTMSSDTERFAIEVRDNGIGIAAERLDEIFRSGATAEIAGRGFGLHMSALIAGEMNGSLRCASDGEGQGASFVLELPQARG